MLVAMSTDQDSNTEEYFLAMSSVFNCTCYFHGTAVERATS